MKTIGIDLGTTNSVAAFCPPGRLEPRVLPNSAGENLTPSVVSLRRRREAGASPEVLVGRAAFNNAHLVPEDTIFSIKRLMGRTYDEPKVAEVREKFNYRLVRAPGEDPGLRVQLGEQTRTPTEISAEILKQIRIDAGRALGDEVGRAVITVPAYFEERQRVATQEAGVKAGLVVKKIIDEPTAAAIAFGVQVEPGGRHRILVFDLGGGTFDVSILQVVRDKSGQNQFEVLVTDGNNWLGGDDFDRKVVNRIVVAVREKYGVDPSADKRFLLLAKREAERAKIALSASQEVEIIVPAALKHAGGLIDVELSLSRAEFEGDIEGFVTHSLEVVKRALKEGELEATDISDVLLVGGSTLVPLVYQTVQEFFGADKVRRSVNPMECVALGASILATSLKGVECSVCKTVNEETLNACAKCGSTLASARAVGDMTLGERTPMSLGIAAVQGNRRDVFAPIIPRGTSYPLAQPLKRIFRSTGGRLIKVPIYEGDHPIASRNEEQGIVEYELPQELSANTDVEVSFNYDRNRALTVTIRIPGANLEKVETLRRDRPRTAPATGLADGTEADWDEELESVLEFGDRFILQYGEFMEPPARAKLQADLASARRFHAESHDADEARRQLRILKSDVLDSGLATHLFLAERAIDGAPPDISARLVQDVAQVRQAHVVHDRDTVRRLVAAMRPLVAQCLERSAGISPAADVRDYDGLLRLPGS